VLPRVRETPGPLLERDRPRPVPRQGQGAGRREGCFGRGRGPQRGDGPRSRGIGDRVAPRIRSAGRDAGHSRDGRRSRAPQRGGAMTPAAPTVRIAAGQGFWGDWLEAPYRQVTGGPVDYLMMDYLAEVTMSIMQKQKSRNAALGYAKDFIPLMERILPIVAERRIKITANAGG